MTNTKQQPFELEDYRIRQIKYLPGIVVLQRTDGGEVHQTLDTGLVVRLDQGRTTNAHTDDEAVDWLAATMKSKLATARKKGRSGWEYCSADELSEMLREHVDKGDPVDVANFCMFLAYLGNSISPKKQDV